MRDFEQIMVCLDTPERDEMILRYIRDIAEKSSSKMIHLVHVCQDSWGSQADDSKPPADDSDRVLLADLEAMGKRLFGSLPNTRYLCKVIMGFPLVEILQYSLDNDIDLIAIGRHFGRAAEKGEKALAARRITMKAMCSVITLPENCSPVFSKILTPVKNADCSKRSLDQACEIARSSGGAVEALNIYEISSGYSNIGHNLKEHVEILARHAEKECRDLVSGAHTDPVDVQEVCLPDFEGDPSEIILNRQASSGAQLVVIGARGRTGAAGVLLGSITEQLIRRCPVPVLAVKKKGETMNLLKALLEIMKLS